MSCAIASSASTCDNPLCKVSGECSDLCQSVYEEGPWLYRKITSIGARVFAWIKIAARDCSAAFTSVTGLSTMLYVAQAVNCLVREVMNQFPQWEKFFKPFDKSQFDNIVWSTRVFTDPHYYVGGSCEEDIRHGRFFAVASWMLGTVWDIAMFLIWLKDQGCRWIDSFATAVSQSGFMRWTSKTSVASFLSGVAILSYVLMFVERVSEIMKGEHVVFSVVDALSEALEAVSAVLALVPVTIPLPAAILQAVAAGIGLASFFLDPSV